VGERTAYRILVGGPEGGMPGRMCVDDIGMDLGEMGWYGLD
jgi:hypothetical protein